MGLRVEFDPTFWGNRSTRKLLDRAVHFYAQCLNIADTDMTIVISSTNRRNCFGLYDIESHKLALKKRRISGVLNTLAHEMIHCEQAVKGRLSYVKESNSLRWVDNDGVATVYTSLDILFYQTTAPGVLPWERMAYDNQNNLYKQFLRAEYPRLAAFSDMIGAFLNLFRRKLNS